jgi:hypothetical protein
MSLPAPSAQDLCDDGGVLLGVAVADEGLPDDEMVVGGKPFHGWSCTCPECEAYLAAGQPRPGEVG